MMELDEETRAELGWGDFERHHDAGVFTARLRRLASTRRYQASPSYQRAHREAALRYYHRNKHNPHVKVRKAA